jgi:hypothetical protein
MAAKSARISCINKTDRQSPWERISHVGGFTDRQWKITVDDAIRHIESGEWSFYVRVGNHDVDVIVAVSRYGNKYLRTTGDSDTKDNLLSLPECP